MYKKVTRGIEITVRPIFLEDQSEPDDSKFVWAYQVKIANNGQETVQLRNRYWRITNARGRIHEVRGAGVVGEQPVLEPGAAFEYTSGTPLDTPSGFMTGTYQMETGNGDTFDAAIPTFSLDSPHQPMRLN